MSAGLLRQDENERNDKNEDRKSRQGATKCETAIVCRLVKEIPDRGTERPRQYESCPEQKHARDARPII